MPATAWRRADIVLSVLLLCFPSSGILNLFGGVLTFKRKAEEALEASGMPYTIVRPGAQNKGL